MTPAATAKSRREQEPQAALQGLPPCDLEAEQATLGAMLLEPLEVIPGLRTLLSASDFYREAHAQLYRALVALADEGSPIDLVTVSAYLKDHDLLDGIGGQAYLARLLDAVPTAASGERYARIVKNKSRLRTLQALGHRLIAETGDGRGVGQVVAAVQEIVAQVTEGEAAETFGALRCCDFLAGELPSVLWIVESVVPGGGLSFLFGKPGTGKSFVAFELARCVATGEPFLGQFKTTSGPTLYFNLEMPPSQFQHRLRLLEQHHPVGEAALHIVDQPLHLNDPAYFARFKALCESIAPALVVIDPLIRALPGVDENEATAVNQALTPACDLAREMGFALLVVHHATKGGERAGLDSLAGTRDFAARADVALLVQALSGENGAGDAQGLLRVTTVKSRWGAAAKPFCFRVQADEDGSLALVGAEPPSAKTDVLELLEIAERHTLSRKEIVRNLEGVWSPFAVDRALAALVEDGQVYKPGRGLYSLSSGGAEPEPE